MTNNIHKYSTYKLFDFLLDPDFKQWVLHPNNELDEYWRSVINTHPTQYNTVHKAIKIVKNLPVVDHDIHVGKDVLWNKIEKRLDNEHGNQPQLKFGFLKYAAAILVILGTISGIWFYQKTTALVHIVTGNGENKSISLPDGSSVILAPNSSLSYHKNLAENDQREIWTTGDARFNVKHINKNPKVIRKGERFIVHLDKKVAVEVLGTIFNVSSRRGSSRVELLSGSVKVSKNQLEVLLRPGESVQTEINERQLTISKKPQPIVREWEQQVALLNRTSVQQIINLIKDTYGIILKVENATILQKEIDGALPLNDREKALQILTSITATNLLEKDGHYLLTEIKQ